MNYKIQKPYFAKFIIIVSLLLLSAPALSQADKRTTNGFSNLPPPCGDKEITIAQMQWPSADILANIHAQIIAKQYGCKVKLIPGDLAAIASSMATTQEPLVAPEMWLSYITEIWNSTFEKNIIRKAAKTYREKTLQAWFIPTYISQNHPELKNVNQLRDYWQVFADGKPKAKFISCPKDWACSIINRNMIKALGLGGVFDIVEPADRFELDNIIIDAISRRKPILFYYWQPNSLLAQFEFLQLDMGKYDEKSAKCLAKINCEKLNYSSFATESVYIVISSKLSTQSPQIAGYFNRSSISLDEMNMLLVMQTEKEMNSLETAKWFIANRAEIWQEWVGQSR